MLIVHFGTEFKYGLYAKIMCMVDRMLKVTLTSKTKIYGFMGFRSSKQFLEF